ncbi:TonB-dependent receptor plug domain-containing protein [Pseudoalteromonas prydzensis]|uniref:TonB-dependent receptor plug domain-containing protein n=1 Tax=Pseudoalteromonas prydzensis TaxID=182141 RepID=UPI003704BCB0
MFWSFDETKTVKKTTIATQVALLLGSSFSFTAFANELEQVTRKPAAEQAKQSKIDDVEVIQVTGIRGSLRDNLNNKRFSDAIVDSINTEDIAKNPDRNMAEALQRVPGVQITNEFGEGSQVSIRGTAPQFTNTLLNGQSLESAASLPLREETSSFDFS